MKTGTREQKLEKAIRLTWDSLESHLLYTYAENLPEDESNEFHKRCVREYAEVIKTLTELL